METLAGPLSRMVGRACIKPPELPDVTTRGDVFFSRGLLTSGGEQLNLVYRTTWLYMSI